MFNSEDFPISTLTFEVRFDPAYLIWDRSGELWNTLLSHEPELTLRSSQPNQQVLETANLQLAVEPTLFRINSRGPKAMKSLVRIGELLTVTVTSLFRISRFTRCGYRCVRRKVFPTGEEALASVAKVVPLFSPREGMKQAGFIWANRLEDDVRGLFASITVDHQEFEPKIPWEWRERVSGEKKREVAAVLDADYYTIGLTDRDAFSTEDWLKAANRFVTAYWDAAQQ